MIVADLTSARRHSLNAPRIFHRLVPKVREAAGRAEIATGIETVRKGSVTFPITDNR